MVQAVNKIKVPTLGVIIARGGSKGLTHKPYPNASGKPVIAYSIEAALASKSLDKVVVTSDDPEVRRVAQEYGVWVLGRPDRLANDTATVDAAARFAVDCVQEHYGFAAGAVAILYGNIPIRPMGLIDMAMNHLLTRGGDSVQSYSPVGKMHPDWMVRLDEDRVILNCAKPIYRRQNLTPMFIPNGGAGVTPPSVYRTPAHAKISIVFWERTVEGGSSRFGS